MKLFQIEEPDGSPSDPDMPGAAIGIDAGGDLAEVAFAVGGNAVTLADREGFERALPVPGPEAPLAEWQSLFEGARLRAERSLARPVTHAVLVFAASLDPALAAELLRASEAAGVELLRIVTMPDLPAGAAPAEAAAILAEDMAPRPESP
ncbi:MAG TPA: hypothetical protein VN900_05185 [Stellaceae bacterium]|jgi:hypothetical protein|nr:hypothetical protein [Stellaceae bacterium]